MSFARSALRLLIGDILSPVSKLRNNSSQERRGILQISQNLDKRFVVKTEACEMLNLFNIAHLPDELIIAGSEEAHYLIFLARCLDSADNFIAVFPFVNELWYHLDGILKVTAHTYRAVACGLQHSVIRRIKLTEVLHVKYRLDFRIFFADLTKQRTGVVL